MKKNRLIPSFLTVLTVLLLIGFTFKTSDIEELVTLQLISAASIPQKQEAELQYLKSIDTSPEAYIRKLSELDSLSVKKIRKMLRISVALLDSVSSEDTLLIKPKVN